MLPKKRDDQNSSCKVFILDKITCLPESHTVVIQHNLMFLKFRPKHLD